jgi:CheY-like chemotaxis protein/anti-sigma regulatory factor (Ser/Thr protein kinase)
MATLSHEIRTPLAGIVGLARTLIDDGLEDRSAAERIERIERSGADLLRIADDALTVAVADNSTLPLRPTTVDLRRHVGEVLDDVRSRSSSDVEVRLMITGHVGSVVIDSARVRQIVGNLVENALRHTSAGHVEVAVEVQGSTCSITVSDTGEGIPSGKLARIFEPFSQVDESATRVGGAGLGLSVVRKVVDAMGGRVTATSVVGLGSRFRVELPVRTAAASESATDLGTDSTPRALLVEDDDTSALVTTAALERLGFEVERLADGRSGVNAVAAGCPHDLVLVDLHLPRTDGFGVISALARRPGQLVAAVTASSHPGDLERCHLLGVDAVFQKPVASEQLADLLEYAEAIGDEARPADPIDTDQLRRLVDLGVHSEVFDLLDAQIPQTRHELLVGDADQVRLALHTMAGSMRVLGATAARHRLSHAEQHLRDGGDLGAVRGEAEDLIRHVIGAVERAEEMVSRLG